MCAQQRYKTTVRILFILSVPFMTLLQMHSALGDAGYLIDIVLAVMIGIAISRKVTEHLWDTFQWSTFLIAAAIAVYLAYDYAWQGNAVFILNRYQKLFELIPFAVSSRRLAAGIMLACYPAIGLLIYFVLTKCLPYVVDFVRSLDGFERNYLIVMATAAAVVIPFLYLHTTVWYHAVWEDMPQLYDVIYTTDSTEIYMTDSFTKILTGPNDIRQPLFGLFALPAGLCGKLVAAVFFFVPDSYAIAMGMIQQFLLSVSMVMLMRILKLEGTERIWFLLPAGCSYAYLLHGLLLEQYVIAYFYVILVLYVYKKSDRLNFAYYGAVSTLLTSGVLFPLISKGREWKKWLCDRVKCLIIYAQIVILCGQLPQFLNMKEEIAGLMNFSGEKVTWTDKWIQFTHFLSGMFWAPDGVITVQYGPCYRIAEQAAVSYVGIAILVCALCGFALSYREWISKAAVLWLAFSVIVLFAVGWGTAENGLILYALYFAWAYLILLYQFLKNVLRKPALLRAALCIVALMMAMRNVYELIQIYRFGIGNYPAF
ncbi:MAG: hypothetical protein HDQ95_02470 [Roseburia sp.]|nr:hypothetical protein [Roseburia sp.]